MNINFSIEIDPNGSKFSDLLSDDIEALEKEIVKQVVRRAPIEMKREMDSSSASGRLYQRKSGDGFTRFHQASAIGQVPAKDSNELYNSIRGNVGDSTITMADHARYLDPIFADYFAGGYLRRPFIFKAISKTLDELV